MPPKRRNDNHTIQDFFKNGNKKQKKQNKIQNKQFIKCPLLGQVGSQLKRVLQQYRKEIMGEFKFGELVKQLSHFDVGNILNSILYLSITRISQLWSEIYSPEHVDDLLNMDNAQYIKFWLKNSFQVLRQQAEHDESDTSETLSQIKQLCDKKTENWTYSMLNIYGATGKISTITAIARTYNIEVLYTYDYTEKREFEEMFASQHISFQNKQQEQQNNELGKKKKIIIHRGALPKFIKSMPQIQRVPLIWITDNQQKSELFDNYEFIPYKFEELYKLIRTILLLEQNYGDQLLQINEEFKQKVIYENIKEKGNFFTNFILPKPQIKIITLQEQFSSQEIYSLIINFQGNMRAILNWVQLNFYDIDVHNKISLINNFQLNYLLINQIRLDNSFISEEKYTLIDDIVEKRKKIIQFYKLKQMNSKLDYYLLNQTFKIISFNTEQTTQQTRMRRLNKDPVDLYKPLQQLFQDEEDFEQFKLFDQGYL